MKRKIFTLFLASVAFAVVVYGAEEQKRKPTTEETVRWLKDNVAFWNDNMKSVNAGGQRVEFRVTDISYKKGELFVRHDFRFSSNQKILNTHTTRLRLSNIERPVQWFNAHGAVTSAITLKATKRGAIVEDGENVPSYRLPCGDAEWGPRCASALNRLLELHP